MRPYSNRHVFVPVKLSKIQGYFLIELLVTVVILSAGIVIIIDSMRIPFRTAQTTLEMEQAMEIGKEVFSEIMANPEKYDELSNGSRLVGSIEYEWSIEENQLISISGIQGFTTLCDLSVVWKSRKEHKLGFPFLWQDANDFTR